MAAILYNELSARDDFQEKRPRLKIFFQGLKIFFQGMKKNFHGMAIFLKKMEVRRCALSFRWHALKVCKRALKNHPIPASISRIAASYGLSVIYFAQNHFTNGAASGGVML